MTRVRTGIVSLLGLMFAFVASPALPDDAAAKGAPARALIERQLDALAHDDGAAAYALASPGIKTMFADSDTFLAMVRKNYAPVYRHQSVEFGQSDVQGDEISQILTIVDNDNVVWKALYKLARQPDGSWLINGCVLIKSTDSST
jgi:Domain of unknown function (DUF4864)